MPILMGCDMKYNTPLPRFLRVYLTSYLDLSFRPFWCMIKLAH